MANRGPGQTLTVTPALLLSGWSGENTYQWLRGSAEISGATSTTYTVTDDDVGSAVTCRQTHRNSAGADSATSAAIDVITNEAFVATLFDGGEDGGWYDPSDLTSMYVGRNGSDGNPSAGSVVGVVLDKSQMGGQTSRAYADSVRSEWDHATAFAEDFGGTSSTWDDATRTLSNASSGTIGYPRIRYNALLTDQKWYFFRVEIASATVAVSSMSIIFGGTGGSSTVTMTNEGGGVWSCIGKGGSTGNVQLQFNPVTSYVGTIVLASVSFAELPGNHLVAPSDAARPLLQTEGGRYYLDFDGVDDYLTVGTPTLQDPFTRALAVKFDADGDIAMDGDVAINTGSIALVTTLRLRFGAVSSFGTGTTTAPIVAVAYVDAGTTQILYENGATADTDTPAAGSSSGIRIGSQGGTAGAYLDGRIYGAFQIDRALTTAERENLEIYLAAKSGATLA